MASLLTTLGLQSLPPNSPQPPSYAASALIVNFLFAHAALSTRAPKVRLGLDHNVSPREDISKYGEKMVQAGKITRDQLKRLIRRESAHANAIENFPFFLGSVILALNSGVPNGTINGLSLAYTLVRVGYAFAYVLIDSHKLSYLRSVLWWSGNAICFTLIGLSGKKINEKA